MFVFVLDDYEICFFEDGWLKFVLKYLIDVFRLMKGFWFIIKWKKIEYDFLLKRESEKC